jgi:glyoxylase-like metal-dependent hydrolase (beta-lactamase superfamily II)
VGKARGFLPQHWPAGFAPTLVDFASGAFGPFPASTSLTQAGDVHLLPTPGHTGGHLSVVVEDDETLVFLAGDASYTQRLMLDGRADGVAPKPSQSIETLTRIQRLVAERPTVYLPSHDPRSVARLAARETAAPLAGDVAR